MNIRPEYPRCTAPAAPALSALMLGLLSLYASGSRADQVATRIVKGGESLSRIAESYCTPHDRLCIRRYTLAIYRANPEIFQGSLAHLSVGDNLRVPAPETIAAIPEKEAMAVYTGTVKADTEAPKPTQPTPPVAPTAVAAGPASPVAATAQRAVPTSVPATTPEIPAKPPKVSTPAVAQGEVKADVKSADKSAAGAETSLAASATPVSTSAAAAGGGINTGTAAPKAIPATSAAVRAAMDSDTAKSTGSDSATAPAGSAYQDEPAGAEKQTPLQDSEAADKPAPPSPASAAAPVAANAAAPAKPPPPPAAAVPGRVRVVYLPEAEKQRIREELREEVLQTARKENWAQPGQIPDWVKHMKLSADFMSRGEGQFYDRGDGSCNTGNNCDFFDFQRLNNSGTPYNARVLNVQNGTNRLSNLPFINSREDRRLLRMRVRLGLDLRVSDDLTMGLRLATGNDSNPVSTNQTLGNDFNKYNFLLDRAFVRYTPLSTLTATLGRAPNPFATGVELVWDRDLSFDGLSLQWLQEKGRNQWRVAGGFFSVENTDPNYPGNGDVKFASRDKYLAGVQGEWSWQWTEKSSLRGSLGYFDFLNAAGQKSTKCTPLTTSDSCDTDVSRPRFVQKGNTMFGIRDLNVGNNDPVYQYYGLASDFRVLDAAASLDHKIGGPLHLALDADYARNLGFNQARVVAREPFNNFSPTGNGYAIGGEGFQVQARIGHPLIRQKGEWQTTLGYRYVESDAVMDAFTDSDFHLGGTNAKGYYVGGYYGFAQNASVGARYLSATEVSGPRLAIDLLQIDINVRY